jgi:hypothetical protein
MSTTAATAKPVETSLDDVTDEALRHAFEDGSLPPGAFRHRHHVRMAWILLERFPVLDVLAGFTAGLRRLAAAAGKPGLYHETITWAYVLLVNERRTAAGAEDWPAFAARNPDLLAWKPSVLEARYYRAETLWSERAREAFVLPDRPLTA